MTGQVEVPHRTAIGNRLAFFQVQQVDDGSSPTFTLQLRQAIDLLPIDAALVGEEQQVGMRAGDEEVLDRILVFGRAPLRPFPPRRCDL